MAEPIKVTVTDPTTGEVLGETVVTDDYVLMHPTTGERLVICPVCLWTAVCPGAGTARARQLLAEHECQPDAF